MDFSRRQFLFMGAAWPLVTMADTCYWVEESGAVEICELPLDPTAGPLLSEYGEETGDLFGYTLVVSSDGLTLATVASGADALGAANAGALYVFTMEVDGFRLRTKTFLSAPAVSDGIHARGITSGGELVLVGAPNRNSFSGEAYIFARTGNDWSEQQIIEAPDPENYAEFGYVCAISDDGQVLVVGEPLRSSGAKLSVGAIYIYERSGDTFALSQTVPSPADTADSFFGSGVALSEDGTILAVTASGEFGSPAAKLYVYTKSGASWTVADSLTQTASGIVQYVNAFETVAISLDGTKIVVGANQSNIYNAAAVNQIQHGIVYAYGFSAGTLSGAALVYPFVRTGSADFGSALAISPDDTLLVVGALGHDAAGSNSGSAYTFTWDGAAWIEDATLDPPVDYNGNTFGRAVGIVAPDNNKLVSASWKLVASDTRGVIHFYA